MWQGDDMKAAQPPRAGISPCGLVIKGDLNIDVQQNEGCPCENAQKQEEPT